MGGLFAARGVPLFCDVFCEAGVFDRAQSAAILQAGLRYGLRPKIHADEFTTLGGVSLAIELAAASVDHLDVTPRPRDRAAGQIWRRGRPLAGRQLQFRQRAVRRGAENGRGGRGRGPRDGHEPRLRAVPVAAPGDGDRVPVPASASSRGIQRRDYQRRLGGRPPGAASGPWRSARRRTCSSCPSLTIAMCRISLAPTRCERS